MCLDLITKANSKDEGTQTYLYTQQPGNPSNGKQITNYKQFQNQLQHVTHYYTFHKSRFEIFTAILYS